MAETKKKAKLSIEEKIARREEMAQKNSNELKLLKRKLSEQKRKARDKQRKAPLFARAQLYTLKSVLASCLSIALAGSKRGGVKMIAYPPFPFLSSRVKCIRYRSPLTLKI